MKHSSYYVHEVQDSHSGQYVRVETPEPVLEVEGLRVLVANEPRSYRETISTVITQLRPHFEVFTAEPLDLERMIPRMIPDCVVCSRLTRTVELEAPAWVELYPEGDSHAVVSVNGERYTYPGMDFDTLLSVLDLMDRTGCPRRRPRAELS